jgi:hypothetical protein
MAGTATRSHGFSSPEAVVLRHLTVAAILVAALVAAVASVIVVKHFGGVTYFPGLVGGFASSLVAFVLALSWERERELKRFEGEARALNERRGTELRRRLQPVLAELEKNAVSIREVAGALSAPAGPGQFNVANPQLLEGAWMASASRVAELTADYQLVADLAAFYGRLEELRWRIRYRTEHQSVMLDGMTAPLVDELRKEVEKLQADVKTQIASPDVRPVGLSHKVALHDVAVGMDSAMVVKPIRGSDATRLDDGE